MRHTFIMLGIMLSSSAAFAVQLHCIGYCQSGNSTTGVRASGTAYPAQLDALKSATTALYNLCKSPKVLSGIKCSESSSRDNGLNSSNFSNVTQAQASSGVVGGSRQPVQTEPCPRGRRHECNGHGRLPGGGTGGNGGTTRKDSAY